MNALILKEFKDIDHFKSISSQWLIDHDHYDNWNRSDFLKIKSLNTMLKFIHEHSYLINIEVLIDSETLVILNNN